MRTVDHQIIYGRRGTGKTHALRYLESVVRDSENIAVYMDLRTVGSPDGLFMGQRLHLAERAGRLLRDLLQQLYDQLLDAAIHDDKLVSDKVFVNRLDAFQAAVTSVEVVGTVSVEEEELEREQTERKRGVGAWLTPSCASLDGSLGRTRANETVDQLRTTRTGEQRVAINFGDMAKAIRELSDSLGAKRIWLLLDEWSSVPPDVQPYLAEFLVRCVLPLQVFTVKIGAIEQQSTFSIQDPRTGGRVGVEVGADIAANLDLDDFMVFEQGSDRAREFFLGLFYKHLTSGGDAEDVAGGTTKRI